MKGFSLLETLLVLAIFFSLMLACGPFLYRTEEWEMRQFQQAFQGLLERARLHALRHNTTVRICPSQRTYTCGKDWNTPLIATDTTSHVLDMIEHPPHPHALHYRHFGSSPYLQFSPQAGAFSANGHFEYCTPRFCVLFLINRAGHLKIVRKN